MIFDLERFAVVPAAVADFARNINIRQEVHLDLDDAVAVAGFAPAALYVEAEPALSVSAHLCLRQRCEQVAYMREHTRISRRVGTRRPADRLLVYVDDLVYILDPFDLVMCSGFVL